MSKLILFLFVCTYAFSQTEIKCDIIQELPFDYFKGYNSYDVIVFKMGEKYYFDVGYFLKSDSGITRTRMLKIIEFNFKTNETRTVRERIGNESSFRVKGVIEDEILLYTSDYILLNPVTNQEIWLSEKYPKYNPELRTHWLPHLILDYQNGIFYGCNNRSKVQGEFMGPDPLGYVCSEYNMQKGTVIDHVYRDPSKSYSWEGRFTEISPDKMHILDLSHPVNIIRVPVIKTYSLPSESSRINSDFNEFTGFLTNSLILLFFEKGIIKVYTINGLEIGVFKFNINGKSHLEHIQAVDLTPLF